MSLFVNVRPTTARSGPRFAPGRPDQSGGADYDGNPRKPAPQTEKPPAALEIESGGGGRGSPQADASGTT